MILEKIQYFDWLNEPLDVGFNEKGLEITTRPVTDFWQNTDCNISKNDGHLFAKDEKGDFSLIVKWSFKQAKLSAQCGIMIYSDEKNWVKAGLLTTSPFSLQVGCIAANNGASDWSIHDVAEETKSLWFRIVRRGKDLAIFYSINGTRFDQIRLLHHSNIAPTLKIGAYACSPKEDRFCCTLEDIDIKKPL